MAIYHIRADENGIVDIDTVTPVSISVYFHDAMIREIEIDDIDSDYEGQLVKNDSILIYPDKLFRIDLYKDIDGEHVQRIIEEIRTVFKGSNYFVEGLLYDNQLVLAIGRDYKKVLDELDQTESNILDISKFFRHAVIRKMGVGSVAVGHEGQLIKLNTSLISPSKMYRIDLYNSFNEKQVLEKVEEIKKLFKDDNYIVEGLFYGNRLIIVLGFNYEEALDKWDRADPYLADYLGIE